MSMASDQGRGRSGSLAAARLHARLSRRGRPLLFAATLAAAAVQIGLAAVTDADGALAWALVGIGVAAVLVLALLAWSGTTSNDRLADSGRIRAMNEDALRSEVGRLSRRVDELEGRAGDR